MMDKAPISVVIPCYLCEKTIERAVESVWNQTIRPVEVIMVEDHSPDNGGNLQKLIQLQSRYPEHWIQIIKLNENKGPGDARNVGWDHASQPYIAFLDSDDAWHPNKIEIQYTFMSEHPQVVLTGHLYNDAANHPVLVSTTEYKIKPINIYKLILKNRFTTPSVMLQKDIPFRYTNNKRFSEDYLLWLQITSAYPLNSVYRIELPLTYLFKKIYGVSGLSSNLWKMEWGELDTYRTFFKQTNRSIVLCYIMSIYSMVKFLIRLFLVKVVR